MKLSVFLAGIIILGFVLTIAGLFLYAQKYYKQANLIRLDPLELQLYPEPAPAKTGQPRILMYGDSRALGWPSPTLNNMEWINRGIGSQSTLQIRMRFAQHAQALEPDILILQAGINDLKNIPLFPSRKQQIIDNCKTNLDWMIEQALAQQSRVIITTIFPVGKAPLIRKPFWSNEVSEAVVQVNQHLQNRWEQHPEVTLVDAWKMLKQPGNNRIQTAYSKDLLHLNAAGYQHLTSPLLTAINSLIDKTRSTQ